MGPVVRTVVLDERAGGPGGELDFAGDIGGDGVTVEEPESTLVDGFAAVSVVVRGPDRHSILAVVHPPGAAAVVFRMDAPADRFDALRGGSRVDPRGRRVNGWMRRAQRAQARLGVAAIACGSLLASLVVPSAPASAQIADGVFVGQIVDFGSFPAANAFENRVTLEVFGGGMSIRGRMRLVIGGEITFETRSSEICVAIDAEVPSTSVLGGGASGSVPVTTTSADGPCGPTSDLTGPVVTNADFSVAFEDGGLRGTLTLPGDRPTAISFVAQRSGTSETATPAGGNAETTSSTSSVLPGLEEAIAARSLGPASLDRINELTNGCIDPLRYPPREGCFDSAKIDRFAEFAKERLGAADDSSNELGAAVLLAAVQDDAHAAPTQSDPAVPRVGPAATERPASRRAGRRRGQHPEAPPWPRRRARRRGPLVNAVLRLAGRAGSDESTPGSLAAFVSRSASAAGLGSTSTGLGGGPQAGGPSGPGGGSPRVQVGGGPGGPDGGSVGEPGGGAARRRGGGLSGGGRGGGAGTREPRLVRPMRWAFALIAVTAPTVFVSPALAQVPKAIDGVYNVQESDLQGTACEPTPFRAALSQGQTGPNYSYPLLVTKSDDTVSFSPQTGGEPLFTATIDQTGAFRGVNDSPFPVEGAFELNPRGEMSFRMSWIRSDGAGTCESSILGILSAAAGSTTSAQPSAVLLADLTIGTVQEEVVSFGQTVPVRVNVEAFDSAGARVDPSRYTPAKVELYQDQTLLDTRLTDAQGRVEFRYTPLGTAPNGRSYAVVRVVAAKDGFAADEDSETIIVERGLVPVEIIIDAAPRQALPGDRITITGRVVSRTMFGLIASRISATVSLGTESVTTDSGGFSLTATVPGDRGLSEESSTQHFRLSAEPREVDRYTSGSADVAVEVQNRGRLQLVMSSPKALYHEDENVTVVGRVTSIGQPLSGPATLALVVNGRPQAPAVTAVDGSFTIRFPARDGVPPRAPPDGEGGGELVVTATAPGFLRSLQRSQLFFVRRGAPPCAAGEGYVASVDGRVDFKLKGSEGVQEFSMRPTPGTRLTRGTRVITSGAGRVALRFPVDRQGGTAVVTVHGDNTFVVDDYCLDASDKVRLVLSNVQHRGQLRVDVPGTGAPDARWQVEVKTPAATVRNVRTSYMVTVDDDGTAVALLSGTVQLDRGASVVELTDGQGAHVPLDPAAAVTTATLTGEADSILGQLVEQAAATPLPPDLLTDGSAGAGGDGSGSSLVAAALAGFALVGSVTVLVARRRRPATTVSAVGSSSTTHPTTPTVTSFRHTHVVPPGGLAAWTTPDATAPPVAHLDPGLEVVVVESYVTGWARVVCSNGWSGWVDGPRLQSVT